MVADAIAVGVRSLNYTSDEGFFMNEQHFKVRGFCDHNNFAGVGMAVPDRVKLFRAQVLLFKCISPYAAIWMWLLRGRGCSGGMASKGEEGTCKILTSHHATMRCCCDV